MILFVIIHQTAQKNKRFARDSADFFRKIVFKKGRGRIWRLRGCAVVRADEINDEAELKSVPLLRFRRIKKYAPGQMRTFYIGERTCQGRLHKRYGSLRPQASSSIARGGFPAEFVMCPQALPGYHSFRLSRYGSTSAENTGRIVTEHVNSVSWKRYSSASCGPQEFDPMPD